MVEAAGIEPAGVPTPSDAKTIQKPAKPQQNNALAAADNSLLNQTCAEVKHNPNISLQQKCVPSVYRNLDSIPEDLGKVIAAWDTLSIPVREAILTIVKNVAPSDR